MYTPSENIDEKRKKINSLGIQFVKIKPLTKT